MFTTAEKRVLLTFREYLMNSGEMLCFTGPQLEQDQAALDQLNDKDLLVKESIKGGYSLTEAGYEAMKACR